MVETHSTGGGQGHYRISSNNNNNHHYPFAFAPEIIRSNQKDAYFQSALLERLSDILRRIYGARFAQVHTTATRTVSDILYLSLTTLIGNRTLGEEYCDIIQIEDRTLRLPAITRRAGYILTAILLPYTTTRLLPTIRRLLRSALENNIRRLTLSKRPSTTYSLRIQTYLLTHLASLTSLSPIYALSLATFYFSGSYYHLSKRLCSLRYIFTKRPAAPESRVGYEVLGVLLVLQLSIQTYLHLHHTLASGTPSHALANPETGGGGNAILDGGVEVSVEPNVYTSTDALLFSSTATGGDRQDVGRITHTPPPERPRYDLEDERVMAWIESRQQRKCTLCLETMKEPSATTCGHVFCWGCIVDWCREKAECPLCRQKSLPQHILPLRG